MSKSQWSVRTALLAPASKAEQAINSSTKIEYSKYPGVANYSSFFDFPFNREDYAIEKVVACFHGTTHRESVMAGQRSIFFIVRDHLSTQLRIENGYEINKHNSS